MLATRYPLPSSSSSVLPSVFCTAIGPPAEMGSFPLSMSDCNCPASDSTVRTEIQRVQDDRKPPCTSWNDPSCCPPRNCYQNTHTQNEQQKLDVGLSLIMRCTATRYTVLQPRGTRFCSRRHVVGICGIAENACGQCLTCNYQSLRAERAEC